MEQYEHSPFQKVRSCINVGAIYLLTIVFGWLVIHPPAALRPATTTIVQRPHVIVARNVNVISGLPNKIVIPGSSWNGLVVNLPVDPGYYDPTTGNWTLSGYHAQFAMFSSLANNYGGETYIYGHNNDYVFGALRHVTPTVGSTALLYTTNGHIFSYSFVSASNVAPDVTSVLTYKGRPIMTIQTCTGSFNEVRTLYRYNFDKVIQ